MWSFLIWKTEKVGMMQSQLMSDPTMNIFYICIVFWILNLSCYCYSQVLDRPRRSFYLAILGFDECTLTDIVIMADCDESLINCSALDMAPHHILPGCSFYCNSSHTISIIYARLTGATKTVCEIIIWIPNPITYTPNLLLHLCRNELLNINTPGSTLCCESMNLFLQKKMTQYWSDCNVIILPTCLTCLCMV